MLKPLSDIQLNRDLNPQETSAIVRYLKKSKIDWDVYLPTINKNLQRPFCWNLKQKREIIWSVLMGRHIPHISIINVIDFSNSNDIDGTNQIIDGKQRISSIFDFIDNKFDIIIDNNHYFFNDLTEEYQRQITGYHLRCYQIYENNNKITDDQKIRWFKFINFAGTAQDEEHLNSLI